MFKAKWLRRIGSRLMRSGCNQWRQWWCWNNKVFQSGSSFTSRIKLLVEWLKIECTRLRLISIRNTVRASFNWWTKNWCSNNYKSKSHLPNCSSTRVILSNHHLSLKKCTQVTGRLNLQPSTFLSSRHCCQSIKCPKNSVNSCKLKDSPRFNMMRVSTTIQHWSLPTGSLGNSIG